MRPAGEVRQALLRAVSELAQVAEPGRGFTQREIAERACVGYAAARHTIDNMNRGGLLRVCGERKVGYRNRPVAEYVPVPRRELCARSGPSDVGSVLAVWAR